MAYAYTFGIINKPDAGTIVIISPRPLQRHQWIAEMVEECQNISKMHTVARGLAIATPNFPDDETLDRLLAECRASNAHSGILCNTRDGAAYIQISVPRMIK